MCIQQLVADDLKATFKRMSVGQPMIEFEYKGEINRYWAKVIALQISDSFRISLGRGVYHDIDSQKLKELSEWARYWL